jgi:hypothetical protein
MSQAKYYSPKITRDLVLRLYWEAQSQQMNNRANAEKWVLVS